MQTVPASCQHHFIREQAFGWQLVLGKADPAFSCILPSPWSPPNSRGTQGVLHPGDTTEMPTPVQALQLNHMEFIHTLK